MLARSKFLFLKQHEFFRVSVEAAPIYVVVGDILLRGRRATIVKLSSRASVVEVWLCASERACGETATLQLRPAEGHWRFMVVG